MAFSPGETKLNICLEISQFEQLPKILKYKYLTSKDSEEHPQIKTEQNFK